MSESPQSSSPSTVTAALVAAVVSSIATATVTYSPRVTVKQEVITAAAYFDASVAYPSTTSHP